MGPKKGPQYTTNTNDTVKIVAAIGSNIRIDFYSHSVCNRIDVGFLGQTESFDGNTKESRTMFFSE